MGDVLLNPEMPSRALALFLFKMLVPFWMANAANICSNTFSLVQVLHMILFGQNLSVFKFFCSLFFAPVPGDESG